jgi:Na+/phosphate symporter
MRKNKNVLKAAAAILFVCVVMIWLSSRTEADDKTYKIRPEVSVGAYRSDTVHVMDAYERLMDRYMSLVESNLNNMTTDVSSVLRKVNSIDRKIDKLGTRITRIEKALDIQQPKPQKKKTAEQKPKQ